MKREHNRKKPQTKRVAPSVSDRSLPLRPLSPGRKRLFRFIAVFVLPLAFLCAVELVLRVLGVGFDPHFFQRQNIRGQDYFVANDKFGWRFFPPNLARVPNPVMMPVAKPAETFRVFVFGESAAMGDPRPNFGASCYLKVLLKERFPAAKFEVVNTSMTAINSHVILPIAQDCAHRAGDLWIVYMGNNEMVGPFGAATVFGNRAPPLWLVRVQLQLQRLRLCQLLTEIGRKLLKSAPAGGWQGMEMFLQNQISPHDPSKLRAYSNFERNLDDILKVGKDSGAKIVLSTVAVNLKDCPPFGTDSGQHLAPANRATFEKLCRDGLAAQTQGRFEDAVSGFQQATNLLPQSAEAQFQLATLLLHLTNAPAARSLFLRAADDDTLPFRADSRINNSIRAAGRRFAGESIALCDAAEILSAESPHGVSGKEFFYEHVHLTPDGNYALALAWAEQVERLLGAALKGGARPSWASQAECERLLGLTDWNRVSILEEVFQRLQRPPFSGQINNTQQLAQIQVEIDDLKKRLTSEAAARARGIYSQVLLREPENYRLHENYAEFLEDTHELAAAIEERRKVCELIPQFYFPYYALGLDLKDADQLSEAQIALIKAAAIKPDQADVRRELGMVSAREGQWETARQQLEIARRLSSDNPKVPLYLGEVLWKLERRSEAIANLREAIRMAPSDWQPHFRLASDLAQMGDLPGAAAEYQEVLRLNPAYIKAKVGLAAVLLEAGRQTEAMRQLDEALTLEPNNPSALELQRKIRGM